MRASNPKRSPQLPCFETRSNSISRMPCSETRPIITRPLDDASVASGHNAYVTPVPLMKQETTPSLSACVNHPQTSETMAIQTLSHLFNNPILTTISSPSGPHIFPSQKPQYSTSTIKFITARLQPKHHSLPPYHYTVTQHSPRHETPHPRHGLNGLRPPRGSLRRRHDVLHPHQQFLRHHGRGDGRCGGAEYSYDAQWGESES